VAQPVAVARYSNVNVTPRGRARANHPETPVHRFPINTTAPSPAMSMKSCPPFADGVRQMTFGHMLAPTFRDLTAPASWVQRPCPTVSPGRSGLTESAV
jgi:hypothetical protein